MKKAGSPTGLKGLTLIETLLAVLILSSAIVFIMPAFFKSGALLSHLGHRCEAELLMNNLIVQKEEDLRTHRQLDSRTSQGDSARGDISYRYDVQVFPQDKAGHLYLLVMHVNWHDFKDNQISRSAYILQ